MRSKGNQPPSTAVDETPWELLRCSLIWFLWCEKVEFDFGKGEFHVGVALFRAWQATVQAGMGAWQEMNKYSGTTQKSVNQLIKEEIFLRT